MSTVNQHIDGNLLSGSGDVQSNSFASHGGPQNIAQGNGAVGCQINNYGNQPPPPPIPCQLPAPEPCFLHREEELVWLNDRLHPGKVAAVCGPGGMGKSALAAQAVHQLEAARFPDGIIFHSFYHQPKVETALQAICAAFQIEAKVDLPTTVQQALSDKTALLILDGTENADDLPAILKLRGTCGVLITSRKQSDALTPPLILRPLGYSASEEMFRADSGIIGDEESVRRICAILDGWPVALRIAGRYLSTTGESAADYLRWLEQEPFKELGDGEHQEENAALLLRRSVAQVSGDARLALGLAGCLAFAPIAFEPVAATLSAGTVIPPQGFWSRIMAVFSPRSKPSSQYSAEDERRARKALGELVTYGLLEKREERWQVSHALIHTYARTELALSTNALKRLAGWYIAFCRAASVENAKGCIRLDAERAHCLRLMESCLASKLWQEVKALELAMQDYLDQQGYWAERIIGLEIRLTAAQQRGDRRDESVCLNNVGYTCGRRGEYAKALDYYQQSLVIDRELGDRKGKGVTLNNIASIYRQQGKHELALEHYQQSLSIQRAIGDREREVTTLNNIAAIYYNQGDYEQALQYYTQCLSIILWEVGPCSLEKNGRIVNKKAIERKILESSILNSVATIYRAQGDYAKAVLYYQDVLLIAWKLGDRTLEAEANWNISLSYKEMGNLAKTDEYIMRAVWVAGSIIDHPFLEKWREELVRLRAARQG